MSFHDFATALTQRFQKLAASSELFVMGRNISEKPEEQDIEEWRAEQRQELWAHYLDSFPPGTNPIYIKNTEHDCACCRQVIKSIANVVAIVDGKTETVWDIYKDLESPYREVAESMRQFVGSQCQLSGVFRVSDRNYKFGATHTLQDLGDGGVKTWKHLHITVPERYRVDPNTLGSFLSECDGKVQVFKRGLEELTLSSIDTVLDLIKDNLLYRGAEFKSILTAFREAHVTHTDLKLPRARLRFIYSNFYQFYSGIRNHAIGTLLQDLVAGDEVEAAVRKFGTKMDPRNYRHPTSFVTQAMIEKAVEAIEDLGLDASLQRRHARIEDVSVSNVLWVDNGLRGALKGSTARDILGVGQVVARKVSDEGERISIGTFLERVLPRAESMQLLVEHQHQPNFVSITKGVNDDAPQLFKWKNNFAWSYDGNVTDSIKERVKAAGGNVEADLRVSLAWHNHDDLDLHCVDPRGNHIYFRNKLDVLDVDMNAGRGTTRSPVENMAFMRPADGNYAFAVHNFTKRETDNVGFMVQLAYGGQLIQMRRQRAIQDSDRVDVLALQVKDGQVVRVKWGDDLAGGGVPTDKWGIMTESWIPVQTIMLSPNHWDGQEVGNKHVLFMLEGCRNPDPVRGIYNEYLRSDLEKHRKVFESLATKSRIEPADNQLSGLGFSETRKDKVKISVKTGSTHKLYHVFF